MMPATLAPRVLREGPGRPIVLVLSDPPARVALDAAAALGLQMRLALRLSAAAAATIPVTVDHRVIAVPRRAAQKLLADLAALILCDA